MTQPSQRKLSQSRKIIFGETEKSYSSIPSEHRTPKENKIYLYIFCFSAKSSVFKPIRTSVFNCLVNLQWTALQNCPARSFDIQVQPISPFHLLRLRRSLLPTKRPRAVSFLLSVQRIAGGGRAHSFIIYYPDRTAGGSKQFLDFL